MHSVLLSSIEMFSVYNSSNNEKDKTRKTEKKVIGDSKDKKIDKFSLLLDTQLKALS